MTPVATIDPLPDRPVQAGLKILLTGVASDSHTWNLVFLQLVLEELGHRVVNLGPCVPPELLVRTCQSARPDLIVMSSVNGHGLSDGQRAVQAVRMAGELAGIPAVIGGKLGIAGLTDRGQIRQLLEAGFDAVFEDADGIQPLDAFLGRLGQHFASTAVESS